MWRIYNISGKLQRHLSISDYMDFRSNKNVIVDNYNVSRIVIECIIVS